MYGLPLTLLNEASAARDVSAGFERTLRWLPVVADLERPPNLGKTAQRRDADESFVLGDGDGAQNACQALQTTEVFQRVVVANAEACHRLLRGQRRNIVQFWVRLQSEDPLDFGQGAKSRKRGQARIARCCRSAANHPPSCQRSEGGLNVDTISNFSR